MTFIAAQSKANLIKRAHTVNQLEQGGMSAMRHHMMREKCLGALTKRTEYVRRFLAGAMYAHH